jgi:hypothetical protein
MIETLYRPDFPITERSERYVLVLTSRAASGQRRFAFMEEHGKWDESSQRLSIRPVSVHADENLTWEDAHKLYQDTRAHLAHRHRRVGMQEAPAVEHELIPA